MVAAALPSRRRFRKTGPAPKRRLSFHRLTDDATRPAHDPNLELLRLSPLEWIDAEMIPGGSRMCESTWMRKGVEVRLGPGDRERLEAVIGSGNSPQKHVWRAWIVLLSADGIGTMAIRGNRQRQADDLALAGAVYGRWG
jgi:hypothetical protein